MGMRADIYRNDFGDCSNGGISGRYGTVTIVDVAGPFEPSDDAPAVRIGMRGGAYHLAPVDQPKGMLGPMMGGCYVQVRGLGLDVGDAAMLPLHDRFETAVQYASLSI